jgi:hypothetical protein
MKRRIAIGCVLACAPLLALAQNDWTLIARGGDNSGYYWRPGTVREIGVQRAVWVKIVPTKPKPVDEKKPDGKKYVHALVLFHLDCDGQTMGTKSRQEYAADNSVVWGHTTQYVEMTPVVPDSVGESVVANVCSAPR